VPIEPTQFVTRTEALERIPDSPCTLEFRSLALEDDATILRSADGLLLVDAASTLCGAIGKIDQRDLEILYRVAGPPRELLADSAAFEVLKSGFSFERAKIAELQGAWKRSPCSVDGLEIRMLEPLDSLDHLPQELLDELHAGDCPILAGFVGGVAVGFAYCASMTETLADISIDTIESYRRRGIATAVVSQLIDGIVAGGRSPVWGAVEDNVASLALAASLGFTQGAGELFVYEAT
jgi:RimJ/RimL family protein N-acetyltransferase